MLRLSIRYTDDMYDGRQRFRAIGIPIAVVVTVIGFGVIARQKAPPYSSKAASSETVPARMLVPQEKTSFVHSPDGTRNLTMTETVSPGATSSSYTFTVTDMETGATHVIYETREPKASVLSLPANSWSPDNKMVFVLGSSGDVSSAFVLNADGSAFADGSRFIDVGTLFSARLPDLTIRAVTGWDDPWLVHVTTRTADGQAGQSYWFDVSTRSFLGLNRKG